MRPEALPGDPTGILRFAIQLGAPFLGSLLPQKADMKVSVRETLRQCAPGDGEVKLLPSQHSQKQMLMSASRVHFWGKTGFTSRTKMLIASASEPRDERYVVDNIGTVSSLDLLTPLFLFCP